MQKKINKYFEKLCNDKFFKNDEETVIGKAKDIIEKLNSEYQYTLNNLDNLNQEEIEFIKDSTTSLISEIKRHYNNLEDIIGLHLSPMSGFYELTDKKILYDDLKEYYEEMEI